MNERELKNALAEICQMLRDEIFYTNSINIMMTALARSILAQNEQLAHSYEKQWTQLAFGVPPPAIPQTDAHLRRLDELIQKLKG